MKVIVVASCDVMRAGIISLISKYEYISVELACQSISEAMPDIRNDSADAVLLGVENEEELNQINETRCCGTKCRFIVMDFKGDNRLFINALKFGVHGYILGKSSEKDIMYAINQIMKGKKYYDSDFVDYLISDTKADPKSLEILTSREREILIEISKGLSNRKICEKFLISEYTVKKHVSHIFEKLNLRDRTEAALYVNKYKIT